MNIECRKNELEGLRNELAWAEYDLSCATWEHERQEAIKRLEEATEAMSKLNQNHETNSTKNNPWRLAR